MTRLIHLGIALLLSAAVTFALFFLMQFLIAMDSIAPEKGDSIKIADITMPDIEIEVQRVQPKPEQPDEPEEIPDLPEPDLNAAAPTGDGIQISRVNVDVDCCYSTSVSKPCVTTRDRRLVSGNVHSRRKWWRS
jgi:hypothetical protein